MSKKQKEIMIDDRNLKMADSIVAIITGRPTFIAVGVDHLAREKGLIRLLEKRGYIVRPVYSTFSGKTSIVFAQELKWKDTVYKGIPIFMLIPFSL